MNETAKISLLGSLLSKKYARDLFKLLKAYKDISASEAASRMNLHVQTVQEFLEGLSQVELVNKEEILEGKRPYFRYQLIREKLKLEFDLSDFLGEDQNKVNENKLKIREKKNPGTQFTLARGGDFFSAVTVLVGSGREKKHRRINLTNSQGKFLYYLPFPDAAPLSINDIMNKAAVSSSYLPEINNLIEDLEHLNVIEVVKP